MQNKTGKKSVRELLGEGVNDTKKRYLNLI